LPLLQGASWSPTVATTLSGSIFDRIASSLYFSSKPQDQRLLPKTSLHDEIVSFSITSQISFLFVNLITPRFTQTSGHFYIDTCICRSYQAALISHHALLPRAEDTHLIKRLIYAHYLPSTRPYYHVQARLHAPNARPTDDTGVP